MNFQQGAPSLGSPLLRPKRNNKERKPDKISTFQFVSFIQVHERSKYYMLLCATAESVLRLDRTQLVHEASGLQKMYLHDYYHESLLQYLENEFSICENRSLFIQVSVKYLFTLKCFCHMCIGSCLLFHIEKTTNTSLPHFWEV